MRALRTLRRRQTAGEVVRAFNEALNRHDLASMLDHLTEDTVFENTSPAPDGSRYVGREAVSAFWQEFLRSLVRRGLKGVQLVTSDAHEA